MLANFIMRGYDAVGGSWIRWTAPGAPDFTGNYYTLTSPTFASLTNVHVLRREPSGSGADPGDWVRLPGVVGPAAGIPFDASLYPDIDDKDSAGYTLLASPYAREGRLVAKLPVGASFSQHRGLVLAEVASGDWVAAVRLAVRYVGQRVSGAADWFAGLSFFEGQGLSIVTAPGYCAGYGRNGGAVQTAGTCGMEVSSGGRAAFALDFGTAPALDMDHTFDVFLQTDGTLLRSAVGGQSSHTTLGNKSYTPSDGTLAITGYSVDAAVTNFEIEVMAFAAPGILSALPGL